MVKIPAWIRGKAPAPEGLSAVHKHRTSSGKLININDEGLTYEEWLSAAGVGSHSSEDELSIAHKAWTAGEDPTEWRARGGKSAKGWKMGDDLEGLAGKNSPRPFYYTIECDDWDAAARKIIETINGVGIFQFDSLQEALDSGPYDSSREFVLAHLHHMKDYYEVFEGSKIRNVFRSRFR